MTEKNGLEDRLEELGRAIGSDKFLVNNVMSGIDAGTVVGPDRIQRRHAISRLMKVAAVAVIVSAAAVSINLLDRSVPAAYAFEQTVEAFRNVRNVHIVKRDRVGKVEDERWIEIGPDGSQARYRQDTALNLLVVDNRENIFVHHKDKNTVVLSGPEPQHAYMWVPFGKLFKDLAGDGSVTVEENVRYEGRRAHRVHWLIINQDCYIDPESKLPIAMGGYEISYEEPPEDIFDIPAVPEGVVLVDKRPGAPEATVPEWMKTGQISTDLFDRARRALADGRHREAADLFARSIEVNPSRNWAWFWLGKAHYELCEYDAAINEFSNVILDISTKLQLVPHYCYLARGLAYAAKGMKNMARQDFDVALPVMIRALRNTEGAFTFDYADDPLLRDGPEEKWPTAPQSLAMMINRLRTATGHSFGYCPDATPDEKERAIAAWEQWYEKSGQIRFDSNVETVDIPKTIEDGDE